MITIFTTPKPFRDRWITIQQNALLSYVRFHPEVEVLVFDADDSCRQFCARHGINCLPAPKTNEHGTPLLSSLFSEAVKKASHDLILYINADTILLKDFYSTLEGIDFKNFLVAGRTFGAEIDRALDVGVPEDEEYLRYLVKQKGNRRTGQDYFLFTRHTWATIPDFAIGRGVWANWLMFDVFKRGIPVIDASEAPIMVVHQNHDWSNHPGGYSWIWEGPEIKKNFELAPEIGDLSGYHFATWRMDNSGKVQRIITRQLMLWRILLLLGGNSMVGSLSRIIGGVLYPRRTLRALRRRMG